MGTPFAGVKMNLSNAQKRYLRGLTHDINPVVMVAGKGLTDNVMDEIEQALERHELIKVKLRGERKQRTGWAEAIAEQCGATPVHAIGQVASFYRRNPKKPVIELPR